MQPSSVWSRAETRLSLESSSLDSPSLDSLWFLFVIFCIVACFPVHALAYTKKSPEVKAMLEKAVKYLEADGSSDANASKMGGKCLIALVLIKSGAQQDHPKVVQAVADLRKFFDRPLETAKNEDHQIVYQVGVAGIFFAELDPTRYRDDLEKIVDWILKLQKPQGGWGYPTGREAKTGDTSMTQYPVLAIWLAKQVGLKIPTDATQEALGWLVRTQDPNGFWGYQGDDPGKNSKSRRAQTPVDTLSLSAAGLGSVYMCASTLNLAGRIEANDDTSFHIPGALRPAGERDEKAKNRVMVGPELAKAAQVAMADGKAWFDEHFSADTNRWPFYYLYALERFHSFRELVEQAPEEEPEWYNAGVELLIEKQGDDGSWLGGCGRPVSTALACLFLMRSSQASIAKGGLMFDGGLLTGGRTLPKDVTNVRVQKGKIVNIENGQRSSVEDVVAALDDPANPRFQELMDNPEQIAWDSIPAGGRAVESLQRLVREGEPAARRMAVLAIGKRRDLDAVPALIYGLSDPDNSVAIAARDALRFVSRRIDGFGMPDVPETAEKRQAVRDWKGWYANVRPDATFWE